MTRVSKQRSVTIIGSTGSIGTQAIDVITANPDRFRVVGLSAGGDRPELLARQAFALGATVVAITKPEAAGALKAALPAGYHPTILTGPTAPSDVISAAPSDVVLNGITGSRGLAPTLSALASGATLALANKESLVAGGPLVLKAAAPGQIVPVDSEHSALAQCLRGGSASEVAKLVLTASGGPFRGRKRHELAEVRAKDALAHPTWDMGPVVTINSATLMNKGLELIEAQLLFGIPYADIDVVVHPQSVIHSMVTFRDGATIAQASPPDMKLPIALALGWPDRIAGATAPCDFANPTAWTFEPLDRVTFPAVDLARHCGTVGGLLPAVFNAANEEAVADFLSGNAAFTSIVDTVSEVVQHADHWQHDPAGVDEVLAAEDWARAHARELLSGRN
jgi:1-deoxy-D-xylulose-5-phosphate reductoisomerase